MRETKRDQASDSAILSAYFPDTGNGRFELVVSGRLGPAA